MRIKDQKGTAAIEFAIITPLLFVLLFGIIEYGAVLYNKAVITNASREAARYVATFYTNPGNATATRPTCTDIQNYAVSYVNAHFVSFTSSTPFGTSNVKCCAGPSDVSCSGAAPDYNYLGYAGYVGTIRIEYQYGFLVLGNLVSLMTRSSTVPWTSITLRAQTSMRDENQG